MTINIDTEGNTKRDADEARERAYLAVINLVNRELYHVEKTAEWVPEGHEKAYAEAVLNGVKEGIQKALENGTKVYEMFLSGL